MDWQTFYKIDVADGDDDFWTELFQFARTEDGNYEFRIWKLLCLKADEPAWVEWKSAEPVPDASLLQEIFEGSSDRGFCAQVTLEAALELLPFLSKDDAELVGRSIAASIQADHKVRKGNSALTRKAKAALRALMK